MTGMAMWKQIAHRKRAARDAAIPSDWLLRRGQVAEDQLSVIHVPEECGILTPRELEITGTNALDLVQKLAACDYTSHEVTLAFCKRAAIAQQLVNCLTEVFFEEALQAAKELDVEYAATGRPRGMLHGLPVSLKDCFHVRGTDATIGYTAFADRPSSARDESEITRIMRDSGAVLFCKTNVPLALMSGETNNPIYGYTRNPFNRNLSSGGSSGGESALLALRGSPLGVGTDVGGSIRIPASFCGLYSLKPSSGRFPTYGIRDGLEGQEAVRNTVGPMATSLAAVEMWCHAVVKDKPWEGADPDCLPIPWRKVHVPKRLCIGLLHDDGIVKPLPPVHRALLRIKNALESAGHTIINFSIDDPLFVETLKHSLYRSAAADLLDNTLGKTGQLWPDEYKMLEAIVTNPATEQRPKNGRSVGPATVSELWLAQVKRTEFSRRILRSWNSTRDRTGTGREMDALLMPCSPWPSSTRGGFIYDNYTSLWNVIDYCATTLPVSTVSADEEELDRTYQCRGDTEAKVWGCYSPTSMVGSPVSVQLVGRRLTEEYLLGVTRVCDNVLKAMGDVVA